MTISSLISREILSENTVSDHCKLKTEVTCRHFEHERRVKAAGDEPLAARAGAAASRPLPLTRFKPRVQLPVLLAAQRVLLAVDRSGHPHCR
jgi:hypothetical protein